MAEARSKRDARAAERKAARLERDRAAKEARAAAIAAEAAEKEVRLREEEERETGPQGGAEKRPGCPLRRPQGAEPLGGMTG